MSKNNVLIMLQTCQQYWTENPDGVIYGPFKIETTSVIKSNPIVTVRDFILTSLDMVSK